MKIGDRQIGPGHSPYIIAEIGVNHDGSVERALELVDSAAQAGADAIKLQLFETDRLMSAAARLAAYQKNAGERDALAMLSRLELDVEQMRAIVQRAHGAGVHAIVTVFSTELVEPARGLGWDAFKSASPDVVHRPLLLAMAHVGLPLIVSTGAATLEEVTQAVGWLNDHRSRLALLQCVSSYPTPDASAALGGIASIAQATGLPTGYSDHTASPDTGALAVAAGACILEKHLTYDRHAAGPDHSASLEPDGFAEYVRLARRARIMLGRGGKQVLPIEEDVRAVSRQSLTAARPLPVGHVLSAGDLTAKRPGGGMEPWRLEEVVGRRLTRAIAADEQLNQGDIA